ncbi:Anthocyanidin 3-O-glucoside 2''-O-glucosyltransferase, partial [Mucuna pruriens]
MDAAQLQMHIAMYPWLAIGHISLYLQLANKLAKRGHRISFFIPKRTKAKFEHFNQHPHLITFISITIPHVDGLPPGAETTFDVPFSLVTLLITAMDCTEKDVELLLHDLKPDIVFFDFACWIPNLTRRLGIKSVQYTVINMVAVAYTESAENMCRENNLVIDELNLIMHAPDGFPDSSSFKLHAHEHRKLSSFMKIEVGAVRLFDRLGTGARLSDAVGFKGCREIEAPYADFLERYFGKPFLISGPGLPEPSTSPLEQKWAEWLSGFKPGSVIYCAFGSEWRLLQNQFEELLLGLELTGFPFLAALKAPFGFDSVEEAIPEGFMERVQGRGIVHEDGKFTKESVCKAVKTVMDDGSDVAKEVRANHLKLRNLLLAKDLENTYVDSFCHKLQQLLGMVEQIGTVMHSSCFSLLFLTKQRVPLVAGHALLLLY